MGGKGATQNGAGTQKLSRSFHSVSDTGEVMKQGYTYILANKPNGTLYIGVTSDIERRIWEHKTKTRPGFSKKYGTDRLVYLETYDRIDDAIRREKQLKHWNRKWKLALIEGQNPHWKDLAATLDPRSSRG